MGNSESNPIRNMDKRTARRTHHGQFAEAVARYRDSERRQEEHAYLAAPAAASADEDAFWADGAIRVCTRKRPIFAPERKALEFDVISCVHGRLVAVHDARMHSDMRRMQMHHNEFLFDRVFSERDDNDAVYREVAAPLVRHAARGGHATCLMYGQTGSGKTYTMTAIYERAAKELFEALPPGHVASVSFFELAGDVCSDLLRGFERAQLLTGSDGSVHAFPLTEVTVADAAALMAMIRHGFTVRPTEATGVHDASSRSHAVLRVYCYPDPAAAPRGRGGAFDDLELAKEGVLTLVDLAGSEHRIDSMHHTAQRRKEGAEINASLMALKNVVHARAKGADAEHLYRRSKLTMALKSSFKLAGARTCVIATVSPASKDTEHSLNTLRHACVMDGQAEGTRDAGGTKALEGHVSGGRMRTVHVGEVDVAAHNRRQRAGKGDSIEKVSSNGNTFGAGTGDTRGDIGGGSKALEGRKLAEAKARQQRDSERRAMRALAPEHRATLQEAREALGRDARQERRLRRVPPLSDAEQAAAMEAVARAQGAGDGAGAAAAAPFDPTDMDAVYARSLALLEANEQALSGGGAGAAAALREGGGGGFGGFDGGGGDAPPAPAAAPAHKKKGGRPKAPPGVFRKLKAIVYSDSTVPEAILAKQFARLLRQKGYSDEGVLAPTMMQEQQQQQQHQHQHQQQQQPPPQPQLHPPGGQKPPPRLRPAVEAALVADPPLRQPPQWQQDQREQPAAELALTMRRPTSSSGASAHPAPAAAAPPSAALAAMRRDSASAGAGAGLASSASAPAASGWDDTPATGAPAAQSDSRVDRVKAARARKIAEEQEALRRKAAAKEQRIAVARGAVGGGGGGGGGIHAEIAALEAKVAAAPSKASAYGIEKQLKAKKALLVREQRKVEQSQREAQRAAKAHEAIAAQQARAAEEQQQQVLLQQQQQQQWEEQQRLAEEQREDSYRF